MKKQNLTLREHSSVKNSSFLLKMMLFWNMCPFGKGQKQAGVRLREAPGWDCWCYISALHDITVA